MKNMRWMILIVMAASVTVWAGSINENYDNLTVQEASAAVDLSANYFLGTAAVVNSSSVPCDPFGGTGNQSLRLYTPASDTKSRAGYASDDLAAGRFSVDFYIPDQATERIDFSLSSASNLRLALVKITVLKGALMYYSAADGWGTFGQAAGNGAAHSLVIDFDTDSNTFSGSLDGTALSIGAATTFAMDDRADGNETGEFDYLFIVNQVPADTASEIFIDNLKVVRTGDAASD